MPIDRQPAETATVLSLAKSCVVTLRGAFDASGRTAIRFLCRGHGGEYVELTSDELREIAQWMDERQHREPAWGVKS